jgi:hypothetical protein
MSAANALDGWRFKVAISDGSGVFFEADPSNDTFNDVGIALAAAFNALPAIGKAAEPGTGGWSQRVSAVSSRWPFRGGDIAVCSSGHKGVPL